MGTPVCLGGKKEPHAICNPARHGLGGGAVGAGARIWAFAPATRVRFPGRRLSQWLSQKSAKGAHKSEGHHLGKGRGAPQAQDSALL